MPTRIPSLQELCRTPSYAHHHLSVAASQLSSLASLGRFAFREPIVVTRDGIVVDGYARWEWPAARAAETILCLEYDLTDEEALRWLIQSHRPSCGLNSYSRVLLALDLEPCLQERARANQQAGGQSKGSSHLTEAQRMDVRSEIGALTGVSTGNVTKAKQLRETAHPRVELAVRTGEISIHKAWQWSRLSPQQQSRRLEEHQSRKGTNQTSRRLIKRHRREAVANPTNPGHSGRSSQAYIVPDWSVVLDSIVVTELNAHGTIAYLTRGRWLST